MKNKISKKLKPKIKRKLTRPDKATLEAALAAMVTRNLSLRAAANEFELPKTTLRRYMMRTRSLNNKTGDITPEAESKVESWILESGRRGFLHTTKSLTEDVRHILATMGIDSRFINELSGLDWLNNFKRRHSNVDKYFQFRSEATEASIRKWFQDLEVNLKRDGINIRQIPPKCIWNCDLSGFAIGKDDEVILNDGMNKYPVFHGKKIVERKITVLGCACASGQIINPHIVLPESESVSQLQQEFVQQEVTVNVTPTGSITKDIYMNWLNSTFVPAIADVPKPVLLFVDHHPIMYSKEVYDLCVEKGIICYMLKKYALHIIQPLDLLFNVRLRSKWKRVKSDLIGGNSSKVTLASFAAVYLDAWRRAYAPDTTQVRKAFKSSGLYPFDPNRPDYSKCQTQNKEPSISSASASQSKPVDALDSTAISSSDFIMESVSHHISDSTVKSIPDPISESSTQSHKNQLSDKNTEFCEPLKLLLEVPKVENSSKYKANQLKSSEALTLPVSQTVADEEPLPVSDTSTGEESLVCGVCPSCKAPVDIRPTPHCLKLVDKLMKFVCRKNITEVELHLMQRKVWKNEKQCSADENYKQYKELYNQLTPCQHVPL